MSTGGAAPYNILTDGWVYSEDHERGREFPSWRFAIAGRRGTAFGRGHTQATGSAFAWSYACRLWPRLQSGVLRNVVHRAASPDPRAARSPWSVDRCGQSGLERVRPAARYHL